MDDADFDRLVAEYQAIIDDLAKPGLMALINSLRPDRLETIDRLLCERPVSDPDDSAGFANECCAIGGLRLRHAPDQIIRQSHQEQNFF